METATLRYSSPNFLEFETGVYAQALLQKDGNYFKIVASRITVDYSGITEYNDERSQLLAESAIIILPVGPFSFRLG